MPRIDGGLHRGAADARQVHVEAADVGRSTVRGEPHGDAVVQRRLSMYRRGHSGRGRGWRDAGDTGANRRY